MRSEIGRRLLHGHADFSDLHLSQEALDDIFGVTSSPQRADYGSNSQKDRRAYQLTESGIAIIPVQGTLMKKSGTLWGWSGCSSYEGITEQIQAAYLDSAVRAIALDIDSPGGETHGAFELSDFIYSLRGPKPIHASANDLAASAAYAIASACDRIYVTRTGAVGSIGVYSMHVDQSGYDEQAGFSYTYIFAGDKKIDGNPYEPLSRSAKKDAQSEVDRQYGIFVNAVARNRNTSTNSIIDTQAGVYFAERAVPLLADEVGTLEECIAELEAEIGSDGITSISMQGVDSRGVDTDEHGVDKAKSFVKKSVQQGEDSMAAANSVLDLKSLTEEEVSLILATRAKRGKKADDADDADDAGYDAEDADAKKAKRGEDADDAEDAEDADDAESKKSKKSKRAEDADDAEDDDEPDDDDMPPKDGKKKGKRAEVIPMSTESNSFNATRIAELCTMTGHPELAAKFLMERKTVRQVEEYFLNERASAAASLSTSSAVRPGSSSAIESLESQAQQLAASSGGKLTKAKAYARLLSANPQAYDQYLSERDASIVSKRFVPEYAAALARIPSSNSVNTTAELAALAAVKA